MKNINKIVAGEELDIPIAKSLGNQKVKGIGRKILIPFLAVAVAGGALALGVGIGYAQDYFTAEKRLEKVYSEKLAQYGDENKDGFISAEENRNFYSAILHQNNAQYNPAGLPIKDGKEISINELINWVKAYQPKN